MGVMRAARRGRPAMHPKAFGLLALAIAVTPAALLMGGFRGLSLVGVLLVVASIVLTILGAPHSKGTKQ